MNGTIEKIKQIGRLIVTTPRYRLIILLQGISGVTNVVGFPLLIPVLGYLNNDSTFSGAKYLKPIEKMMGSLGLETNFYTILIIAGGLILTGQCLIFVSTLLAANAQAELSEKYKKQILEAYSKSSWPWLISNRSGEISYSIISEADLAGVAHLNSQRLLIYAVQIAVLLFVTFTLSAPITLLALGIFGVLTLLSSLNSSLVLKLSREYNERSKVLANDLHDLQQNKKFLKVSLLNKRVIDGLSKHINDIAVNTKQQNYWIEMQRIINAIFILSFLVILMFFHQQLSIEYPLLLLILLIFLKIAPQFTNLVTAYVSLDRNIPMYLSLHQRLKEFKQHEESNGREPFDEHRNITFHDVSFAYSAGNQIFSHLNLSIVPGKTTAIVGASGVGKSTLLDLILRLIDPESGEIAYGDVIDRDLDKNSLRNKVAYVGQETTLVEGTLRDNLVIRTENISENKLNEVVRKVGLDDVLKQLSEGLDTHVGENGIKLSGGQRQRVALARALFTDPKILILDEATSSLDAQSEVLIQETIRKLKQDFTIILVTHKLSSVKIADQIYVLQDGRVCETGTYEELIKQRGTFYAFDAMQR